MAAVPPPSARTWTPRNCTSSMGWPGMPVRMEQRRVALPSTIKLLTCTRRNRPTAVPRGPRKRAPRRRNSGAEVILRIVTLVTAMFSSSAPSTLSSARPWQPSKRQLAMVMFSKPPFDSVPHLIRPVRARRERLEGPVQHRSHLKAAADEAIGDGDVLGSARGAQRIRAFGADAVVPGGVHGAMGDAHIPAAIQVHAVAVGLPA